MIRGITRTIQFLRALAADPRIPARDKAALAGLLAYLANPFDLIPDFIPLAGYLDDLFVAAALVLDYVFNLIPETVILEHSPWKPERYRAVRRRARFAAALVPKAVRRRLWKAAQAPAD